MTPPRPPPPTAVLSQSSGPSISPRPPRVEIKGRSTAKFKRSPDARRSLRERRVWSGRGVSRSPLLSLVSA